MSISLLVFLSISLLFLLLLAVKQWARVKLCPLCLAVGSSWFALLILNRLGIVIEPIITALLLGQSVVGVYYMAEKRVPERYHVFRLPFLLTFTLMALALLGEERLGGATLFVAGTWVVFGILYTWRQNTRVAKIVQRVIACCRDW